MEEQDMFFIEHAGPGNRWNVYYGIYRIESKVCYQKAFFWKKYEAEIDCSFVNYFMRNL
jgi:hypothetical protein